MLRTFDVLDKYETSQERRRQACLREFSDLVIPKMLEVLEDGNLYLGNLASYTMYPNFRKEFYQDCRDLAQELFIEFGFRLTSLDIGSNRLGFEFEVDK